MSKEEFKFSKEEYELMEKLAEQHGVTIEEEFQAAILYFLKTHDVKLFDEAKQHVAAHVLKIVEETVNLK